MFSMCGLLCRFLRGWRQSEAVGIMVHAASLKDASLVVEAIGTCSKFSSSLQDGENHQSLFCQPLCGGQETRQKQLLWRDNSKQATLASPKETVNLVRWTVFLTKSPYQKDDFRRDCSHAAASAPSTPLDSSPRTSRKNSTCSDCDNVITVLLEASYREKEEESLYGYNVMVEHLAEPYAWKVRDMFGVIIYTTPTKLVSMIHAFFNNALVIDEDLSIRKILTVDLVGEPSCLTDPSTISESVTPGPWSHSNSLTQMELARASSPGLGLISYEAMKREGTRMGISFEGNGSCFASLGPKHPSLVEAQKVSSQSSEEEGSSESDSMHLELHQLCPRGWAVSGLRPRTSFPVKGAHKVILGQPLSMNRGRGHFLTHGQRTNGSSSPLQPSFLASIIPNPLNEFLAFKESLSQRRKSKSDSVEAKDKSRPFDFPKGLEKFFTSKDLTNPLLQHLPQVHQPLMVKSKAAMGFSPKIYGGSPLLRHTMSLDASDNFTSVDEETKIERVITQEPKQHIHPTKMKSEADLLKTENIIKDNLANIIEKYLMKSPRGASAESKVGKEFRDPKVLLINNDEENSESILMVTMEETEMKINDISKSSAVSEHLAEIGTLSLQCAGDVVEGVSNYNQSAFPCSSDSFYLSSSKNSDGIPIVGNNLSCSNVGGGQRDGFTKKYLEEIERETNIFRTIGDHEVERSLLLKNCDGNQNIDASPIVETTLKVVNSDKLKEKQHTKNIVEGQESIESDNAELSFSEDSLNENLKTSSAVVASLVIDTNVPVTVVEEGDGDAGNASHKEDTKSEIVPPKSGDLAVDSKSINQTCYSETDVQKSNFKHLSDEFCSHELESTVSKHNKNVDISIRPNLSEMLSKEKESLSPLDDSVKSICNSVSFEDYSFSEDSLASEKDLGNKKEEGANLRYGLDSAVSTPEEFAPKGDSADGLSMAEFPIHWHEEYVKIFSDANQDLRECMHSSADTCTSTLEPIREVDYSLKESSNLYEENTPELSECSAREFQNNSQGSFAKGVLSNGIQISYFSKNKLQPIPETQPFSKSNEGVSFPPDKTRNHTLFLPFAEGAVEETSEEEKIAQGEMWKDLDKSNVKEGDGGSNVLSQEENKVDWSILQKSTSSTIDSNKDISVNEFPETLETSNLSEEPMERSSASLDLDRDIEELMGVLKQDGGNESCLSQRTKAGKSQLANQSDTTTEEGCGKDVSVEVADKTLLSHCVEVIEETTDEGVKNEPPINILPNGMPLESRTQVSQWCDKSEFHVKLDDANDVDVSTSKESHVSVHSVSEIGLNHGSPMEGATNDSFIPILDQRDGEVVLNDEQSLKNNLDYESNHFRVPEDVTSNQSKSPETGEYFASSTDEEKTWRFLSNNRHSVGPPAAHLTSDEDCRPSPTSDGLFSGFLHCNDPIDGRDREDLDSGDGASYLRSDDALVFSPMAKAMLSPVDSAPESGFASLKDSSHSEATSDSGSGVPLSKSKDSLEMTDSERDRTAGMDEFDALSHLAGETTGAGSSPASMGSSARGSLRDDLVFGQAKDALDVEDVRIPSDHWDTPLFPFNASPSVPKRGKLVSVVSLDSSGYRFSNLKSSGRPSDSLDYLDTPISKDEATKWRDDSETGKYLGIKAIKETFGSEEKVGHDNRAEYGLSHAQDVKEKLEVCIVQETGPKPIVNQDGISLLSEHYNYLNSSSDQKENVENHDCFSKSKMKYLKTENIEDSEIRSKLEFEVGHVEEGDWERGAGPTGKEGLGAESQYEKSESEDNGMQSDRGRREARGHLERSGSEEAGGQVLKTSDSVSSSDTIISRASFEERRKMSKEIQSEDASLLEDDTLGDQLNEGLQQYGGSMDLCEQSGGTEANNVQISTSLLSAFKTSLSNGSDVSNKLIDNGSLESAKKQIKEVPLKLEREDNSSIANNLSIKPGGCDGSSSVLDPEDTHVTAKTSSDSTLTPAYLQNMKLSICSVNSVPSGIAVSTISTQLVSSSTTSVKSVTSSGPLSQLVTSSPMTVSSTLKLQSISPEKFASHSIKSLDDSSQLPAASFTPVDTIESSREVVLPAPSERKGVISLTQSGKPSPRKKSKTPKSFEEISVSKATEKLDKMQASKVLSKSLSGEAMIPNGRLSLSHSVVSGGSTQALKLSNDSLFSLRSRPQEGKHLSLLRSDVSLGEKLYASSSSEKSPDGGWDRSPVSSRGSTTRSSSGSGSGSGIGSGELLGMGGDRASLKSQDSLDKFSHFESIRAQARPRTGPRRKVLSVEVDQTAPLVKNDTMHRSITLPSSSLFSSKEEKKRLKQEEKKKKKDQSPEGERMEKKSSLLSLKGLLRRTKGKDKPVSTDKKSSPSLFRKLEKRAKGQTGTAAKRDSTVSISEPIPIRDVTALDAASLVGAPLSLPHTNRAQKINGKTHPDTDESDMALREDVMNTEGRKSSLHRIPAYASSSEGEMSPPASPRTSPHMKRYNGGGSPRLYRRVLLRNLSSSQESLDNASPPKTPHLSSSRRASESSYSAGMRDPVPLMGTRALMASPKSFSVTIGFKPRVEDSPKKSRTMSMGDDLHRVPSAASTRHGSPSAASTLTKRSSSMEILVYGKIREHNPSRKRSGGCSREGSFKLHREISVETLLEFPEGGSFPLKERPGENYQEYLHRVHESRDSRQSSTWSLCENDGSISESLPLDGPFSHPIPIPQSSHHHTPIHKKFSLPPNMHLSGPEEVSSSNPNLARGGSPFATRGIPLSSSFTSSPFRRSHAGASPGYSPGFSPVKRGLASQGKSITSPGNDSCPASPLFEEEEFDFPLAEEEEEEEEERVVKEEVRAPNVLVYTANNPDYFEDVKETLNSTFAKNRYVIYHLTDEMAFRSPWKACTTLLVVCGDVPTHVSTVFIRYLLSGGKVLSICSDFLNVAVPLFGTVEVQEASVVSMSYGKWKNVQLLHHQHCFHSSPKHKRISKDLEKKVSNTGSAVSVEPTFVEITDEYGTRHRLDLQVLAKDDTWGAPALLVADVNEGKGKALFSQVHLEKNPNVSICFNLRGEQLKKCNEWRLEILKDLLSTHLTMDAEGGSEEKQSSTIPSNSPAFLLAEHEAKQKFMNQIKPYMSDGKFSRPSFTLKFQKHTTETPSKDQLFLPVFTTGCPTNFSTVKYFEGLKTTTIGRVVIYSEVISSTMDIIRGSPPIGNGVVVLTTQQTKGKGRQGNVWLSPLGCNMFSLQLHFPLSSNMGQCLPFLQHIIALSAILAVKGTPGYERIPLYLKWPNDIYLGKENKIGGVIVEGSTQKKTVIANVGCGVNLWNSVPTSCVNKAIRDYNTSEGTQLEEFGRETFCANLFSQMEMLLNEFQDNGPDRVIAEYYKHWLHGNARVTVQNELGVREAALVSGIDQYGFLIAELSSGETVLLHPDGNSFNMMEGLLYTKIPTGTA